MKHYLSILFINRMDVNDMVNNSPIALLRLKFACYETRLTLSNSAHKRHKSIDKLFAKKNRRHNDEVKNKVSRRIPNDKSQRAVVGGLMREQSVHGSLEC